MRKILFCILFAVCVNTFLSHHITTDNPLGKENPFAEPFHLEDFMKPPKIEDPRNCHISFAKCFKKLKYKSPICALYKKDRLISFSNYCEVHLQNCLEKSPEEKAVFGVASEDDIVFYNGKPNNCHYYLKNTKTIEDAIAFYHKTGYYKNDDPTNNKIEPAIKTI